MFQVDAKTGDLGIGCRPRAADPVAAAGSAHTGDSRTVIVGDHLRPLGGIRQGGTAREIPAQVGPVAGRNIVVAAIDAVINDADDHTPSRVSTAPGSQQARVNPVVDHLRCSALGDNIETDAGGRLVDKVPLAGEIRSFRGVIKKQGIVGEEWGGLADNAGRGKYCQAEKQEYL